MNKVLICPFFGDLPPWMDRYWENAEILNGQGYDFLLEDNEDDFRDRVRDRLGIEPPKMAGTGNVWDFRPALGFLYEEEIRDFAFWGHTDFDCVYGRVNQFYPDGLLARHDILSDHWEYMCGPWTLYRNSIAVTELFLDNAEWAKVMTADEPQGWPEFGFAHTARTSLLNVHLKCHHSWENPHLLRLDDGVLTHDGREVPFHHFRHTKEWPL